MRKALDKIIQAPDACHFDSRSPQPVFLGLEERRRKRGFVDRREIGCAREEGEDDS
jgi:hypothetical protein